MRERQEDISPEVRAFIADHLGSVVQLETLLMLHAAPERAWTADDVASSLKIDPAWAEAQLAMLRDDGLAQADAGAPKQFRYAPHNDATRAAVDALAITYAERRVTVISLIFSKPADNLKAFSDAFRLRKDKPHG
jgi:predicted ArsR family transcriptional regulator